MYSPKIFFALWPLNFKSCSGSIIQIISHFSRLSTTELQKCQHIIFCTYFVKPAIVLIHYITIILILIQNSLNCITYLIFIYSILVQLYIIIVCYIYLFYLLLYRTRTYYYNIVPTNIERCVYFSCLPIGDIGTL